MMLALLLTMQDAASEVMVKPTPAGAPQNWITDDDYPPEALARHQSGAVTFALLVDAAGKVTDCRVLQTSGFVELDQHSCGLLILRARFNPGRDAGGKPVRSIYRGTFTWRFPGDSDKQIAQSQPSALDLEVSLGKLPQTYQRPALVRVHFTKAGKTESCRVELGSGNIALDKIACDQAMLQASPADNHTSGFRVDTRMVSVTFMAAAAH